MDALSQTLSVVRLVGAIFINAKFTAPWCYQSPSAGAAAPHVWIDDNIQVVAKCIAVR